jgi:NgoMIV restriction enzyme
VFRTALSNNVSFDIMADATISHLRAKYHAELCRTILGRRGNASHFSNADGDSKASAALAAGMAQRMSTTFCGTVPAPQAAGSLFASATSRFLESTFALLHHLRPGGWNFSTSQSDPGIAAYDQYRHLADLREIAEQYPEVKAVLGGDYIITPDIVVARQPLTDSEIEAGRPLFGDATVARLTPLRAQNVPRPLATLHASISCKWTIRSDRAQNTRTEALNLIRNRKGGAPDIIVVTAEPLPSRISSIAIGTGDVDCTYHAALYELMAAAAEHADLAAHSNDLQSLVQTRRLRDISDLPFDLAL